MLVAACCQVEEARRTQFASFADSVEIGLYDYQGSRVGREAHEEREEDRDGPVDLCCVAMMSNVATHQGVERLFDLLVSRYGQRADARRQIAILFSFLEQ